MKKNKELLKIIEENKKLGCYPAPYIDPEMIYDLSPEELNKVYIQEIENAKLRQQIREEKKSQNRTEPSITDQILTLQKQGVKFAQYEDPEDAYERALNANEITSEKTTNTVASPIAKQSVSILKTTATSRTTPS